MTVSLPSAGPAAPTSRGTRTFVGFGFGAIQAGLFLNEAKRSGSFERLVVAEVVPEVVDSVRRGEGRICVNVAHEDGIEVTEIESVEIRNPDNDQDREHLIDAVARASEIATAVPSVNFFASERPGSLHRILAAGLREKVRKNQCRAVVYTAENHNHAAEVLRSRVLDTVPELERGAVLDSVRFVNTVIGKMSGVVSDLAQVRDQGLRTVTTEDRRAFLVEEFNRILISRIDFRAQPFSDDPFERGIRVFEEKDDLLPFEEAKLYGHNAVHALAACVGRELGVVHLAELRGILGVMPFLRAAFIEESGEALVRKYRGVDHLFTHGGFREYADDLLRRMTNPHLRDTVERVGRDPERKLGWDDRLIGTMRLATRQNLQPRRFALGVALALESLRPGFLESDVSASAVLESVWATASPSPREARKILDLVEGGRRRYRRWKAEGMKDIEIYLCRDD